MKYTIQTHIQRAVRTLCTVAALMAASSSYASSKVTVYNRSLEPIIASAPIWTKNGKLHDGNGRVVVALIPAGGSAEFQRPAEMPNADRDVVVLGINANARNTATNDRACGKKITDRACSAMTSAGFYLDFLITPYDQGKAFPDRDINLARSNVGSYIPAVYIQRNSSGKLDAYRYPVGKPAKADILPVTVKGLSAMQELWERGDRTSRSAFAKGFETAYEYLWQTV